MIRRKDRILRIQAVMLLLFFEFTFTVLGTRNGYTESQVPGLINYQGKITDASGEPLADGNHEIEFRIWRNSTPQEPEDEMIWGWKYKVWVVDGHFNVILGATDGQAIAGSTSEDLRWAFDSPARYLEISLAGQQAILPRQQVLSAPYSMISQFGVPVGGIIAWIPPEEDPGTLTLAQVQDLVPKGFVLCDGSQPGVPNLLADVFLRGAVPALESIGEITGSNTHRHTYSGRTGGAEGAGYHFIHSGDVPSTEPSHSTHDHELSGSVPEDSQEEDSHMPQYASVLYIMRIK